MFKSPLEARERILLYGEPGTGKSNAVISLAKFLAATKSPSTIYVIDNDRSYSYVVEKLGLTNVRVYNVFDFPEYAASLNAILKLVKPDDWLVCDLMSEAWSAAQTYYTDQIHGDEANYFIKVRQAMKDPTKENVLDGWTDWQYINKIYFDFSKPFVYKSPCHILATSTSDGVMRAKPGSTVGDDKDTINVFGSVGHKPEGQKRLKHQFNTTIFCWKDNRGTYRMTAVKDRERELIIAKEIKNFALDYLKDVAGWQMVP